MKRSRSASIPALGLIALSFLVLTAFAASGSDIDFLNGTWSHPSGTSTAGWDSTQTTGTTVLPDGTTATVTVTLEGSAQAAGSNLQYMNNSAFVGFAFQQYADDAENSGSLANYMRIDIQFSAEVELASFVINDVDAFEVIQVEGWSDTPAGPGSGIAATYTLGSNLESYTLDGISGVTPKASVAEYTNLDSNANVSIGFNTGIKGLSVYYSKQTQGTAGTIAIGLEGNIQVLQAPPRLLYTYTFTNDEADPVKIAFVAALPPGLSWDTTFTPQITGSFSGGTPQYANQTVEITELVLQPGSSSITFATLGTTASGSIEAESTMATIEPPGPSKGATATIVLP